MDNAVKEIHASVDFNEAERLEVDQDTQGVLGSPAITDTIFEKIENATIVAIDVTLVGETRDSKKLLNSNVAYELGYAHGIHGPIVLLKIMNVHYGKQDELPFDLKHRRWPISFNLSPDANIKTISFELEKLVKQLIPILRKYLSENKDGKNNSKPFTRYESQSSPAEYWKQGEALSTRKQVDKNIEYRFPNETNMYLRVSPTRELPELRLSTLLQNQNFRNLGAPLGRGGANYLDRNKHGIISFTPKYEDGDLFESTQVFRNGEIWGVNGYMVDPSETSKIDGVTKKYIPSQAYEDVFKKSLIRYLKLAKTELGYIGRIEVEAGLVAIDGYSIAMSPQKYFDQFWGPIFDDQIIHNEKFDIDDETAANRFLLTFFEKVFDSAGRPRPNNLYGFPTEAN